MGTTHETTNQPPTNEPNYQCSACEASYETEVLTRIHITRSTDEQHKNLNGMMPEVVVHKTDETGSIIEDIDGRTTYDFNLNELSVTDFPKTYTERERVVLMVAGQNPHEHTYSKINSIARDECIRQGLDPLPYNHARNTIKKYYEPQTMTQTKTLGKNGLSELTTNQQGIVIGRLKYPKQSGRELASRTSLSYSYFHRICGECDDLIQDLQAKLDEDTTIAELLQDELSDDQINDLHKDGFLDAFDIEIEGVEGPVEEREETLADLTTRQQAIVIAKLVHPDVKNSTIAARVGTSDPYPKQVFERAADVLASMTEEIDAGRSVEDVILDQLDAESVEELVEGNYLDDVDIDLVDEVEARMEEEAEEFFDLPVTEQEGVMSASPQPQWDDRTQATTINGEQKTPAETGAESNASNEVEVEAVGDIESDTEETVEADVETVPVEELEVLRKKVEFFREATAGDGTDTKTQLCHSLATQFEKELNRIIE